MIKEIISQFKYMFTHPIESLIVFGVFFGPVVLGGIIESIF